VIRRGSSWEMKKVTYRGFSSTDTIRVIKSRRMKWVGLVITNSEGDTYINIVRYPKGKNHLRDLGVDGRIILT
jgi:hypothetical protein